MKEPARRFPPPWHVYEATGSFCIRDAKGPALAYYEEEPGRRIAMHRLTRDEARRTKLYAEKHAFGYEPAYEKLPWKDDYVASKQTVSPTTVGRLGGQFRYEASALRLDEEPLGS